MSCNEVILCHFFLTGLRKQSFYPQIMLKSCPSCYRKAHKTISVQESVPLCSRVRHRRLNQQEPSQLTQKWVGWMANVSYVCRFFLDLSFPTRDGFTHREAHFDALMSGKRHCLWSCDQKGDSYRVQLKSATSSSSSTQSWQANASSPTDPEKSSQRGVKM